MSEQTITNGLLDYGLTEPESKIYLYLAKKGATPAGQVSKAVKIQRGQTYNILKTLQEKGIVEMVPEKPTKFSAVPLPKALNSLMQTHKQKEQRMEKIRPELLSAWQSISHVEVTAPLEERFQFLKGVEGIYRKTTEIIKGSQKQVSMSASESALYHVDRLGVIDELNKAMRRNVQIRVLGEVTSRVQQVVSQMDKINLKSFSEYSPPHFVIIDQEEIVFLTRPLESTDPREATAVWTNSPTLIKSMQGVFENMWSSSGSVKEAVKRIPEKKPAPPKVDSSVIKGIQDEIAKPLKASGLKVEKDYVLVGTSGTEHVFSLASSRNGGKPTVIDIVVSTEPVRSGRVVQFYAKSLDVKKQIADAKLVVKPGLNRDARELAALYQINLTELGP